MSERMGQTEETRRRQEVLTATVLVVAGLAMAVSIGIATLDPTGFFGLLIAVPGQFFFSMLHVMAWWVPLYFFVLAALAARTAPVTWASIALINVVHIPVLTIAVILRLLTIESGSTAPLLTLLIDAFTLRGAMLVLSLLLAIESLILLQIWRLLDRRAVGADEDDRKPPALRLLPPVATRETRTGTEAPTAGTNPVGTEAPGSAAPKPAVWPGEPDEAEPTDTDEDGVAEDAVSNRTIRDETRPAGVGANNVRTTLAALRARMEEGLETEPEPMQKPDAPLPLIFGRHRAADDSFSYVDDEPAVDAFFDDDDDDFEDDEFEDGDLEDDELAEVGTEAFVDDPEDDEAEAEGILPGDASGDGGVPGHRPTGDNRPTGDRPRPGRPRGVKKYSVPVDGILQQPSDGRYWEIDDGTRDAGEVLRVTLEEFGIKAEVTGIRKGPVITMFEILPAPGVKLAKITNLADNIALRLAASSVRIVAPIPGKHAVGIEIPNRERNIVSFAELLRDDEFFGERSDIPIALGKDIAGEAQIVDLTKTPHMLIAGATGSGKSVCVNSIICSILYRRNPSEVKLILIDPKIVELKFYNDIPHLLTPVITDPKRAFQALQYLIYEMERRYSLLDSMGARDISGYNGRIKRKNLATEPLPYIVVLIDEFADLMATSGKELESTVARLAAMSRAVGIHLVLATQRPSTDVITGLIKANIPSRIAFMVASKVDSRIIIDSMGAEKLLGRGDMLFTSAADPFPVRMQGAFLSEEEVERVVAEVKTYGEPDYIDDEIFIEEDEEDSESDVLEDPLMERAIEVVTTSRKASASYLQRRLKVGYNRAARMVEEMERIGIVGPQNGSKPRDVIGSGGGV